MINKKSTLIKISKNKNELTDKKVKDMNCYTTNGKFSKKILHIIITRFLIEFNKASEFNKKLYTDEYIQNGIRVMKEYLFPSLEHQNCKNFIWMLRIGNKANLTKIQELLNFKRSFKSIILFDKDHKNYIRNMSKNMHVLITTRIDYDDRIYYNAVNYVRKAINETKPMLIYGYHKGLFYYEKLGIYTNFISTYNNNGALAIFMSLIIFLNKVNDTYTIYEIGDHTKVKKELVNNYKKFGLNKINYDTAIFEKNKLAFVYVRHYNSHNFKMYGKPKKNSKPVYFDLAKFYGMKNKIL